MDGDMQAARSLAAVAGDRTLMQTVSVFLESPSTSAIDQAMLEVQAALVNPRPNATGYVRDERGNRSYRYTTLDHIIDISREELTRNKVLVRNHLVKTGQFYEVVTMLKHAPTGEYIGTAFPTTLERGDHQKLAAAITFGRRYNLTQLLNLATEADSDAGGGEPDEHVVRTKPAGAPATGDVRGWIVSRSFEQAEPTPAMGLTLLKALHAHADLIDQRFAAHRDERQAWDHLRDSITEFLAACFTAVFAVAWSGILCCRDGAEVDAFRVRYDTNLKDGIDKLRVEHKSAVAYLTQHLILQAKKTEAQAQLRQAYDTEVAAVEAAVAAEPVLIEGEAYPFLDAFGEPIGDVEIDDPIVFAEVYVDMARRTAPEHLDALQQHNDAALAWIATSPAASAVLEEGMTPPAVAPEEPDGQPDPGPTCGPEPVEQDTWEDEPLRVREAVQVPRKRGNQPDLAGYVEAIQDDLATVNDQPSMRAWLAVNEPIYEATGFPISARMKASKAATARRLLLGMPPSADAEG